VSPARPRRPIARKPSTWLVAAVGVGLYLWAPTLLAGPYASDPASPPWWVPLSAPPLLFGLLLCGLPGATPRGRLVGTVVLSGIHAGLALVTTVLYRALDLPVPGLDGPAWAVPAVPTVQLFAVALVAWPLRDLLVPPRRRPRSAGPVVAGATPAPYRTGRGWDDVGVHTAGGERLREEGSGLKVAPTPPLRRPRPPAPPSPPEVSPATPVAESAPALPGPPVPAAAPPIWPPPAAPPLVVPPLVVPLLGEPTRAGAPSEALPVEARPAAPVPTAAAPPIGARVIEPPREAVWDAGGAHAASVLPEPGLADVPAAPGAVPVETAPAVRAEPAAREAPAPADAPVLRDEAVLREEPALGGAPAVWAEPAPRDPGAPVDAPDLRDEPALPVLPDAAVLRDAATLGEEAAPGEEPALGGAPAVWAEPAPRGTRAPADAPVLPDEAVSPDAAALQGKPARPDALVPPARAAVDLRALAAVLAPAGRLEVDVQTVMGLTLLAASSPPLTRDAVVSAAFRFVSFLAESPEARSVTQATVRGGAGVLVITPLGPPHAGGPVLAAAVPQRGALALLEILSLRVAEAYRAAQAGLTPPDAPPPAGPPVSLGERPVPGRIAELVGSLAALGPLRPVCLEDPAGPTRLVLLVEPDGDPQRLGRFGADLSRFMDAEGERGGVGPVQSVVARLGGRRVVVRSVAASPGPATILVALCRETHRPGLTRLQFERLAARLATAAA
jgi:hypothetical protein